MNTSNTVANTDVGNQVRIPTTLKITPERGIERFPATALQAGMMYHAEANPGTGVDIEQISIELEEDIDPGRLLNCWRAVFARCPSLGSTFGWDSQGHPFTEIGGPFQVPVEYLDWRNEPSVTNSTATVTATQRSIDFDLASGPLHRLVIAQIDESRWWLLWTFHHIILDGRSFPLLLQEIFALHDAPVASPSLNRGARMPSGADFGRYLTAVADRSGDAGEAAKAARFWQEELRGFETANTLTLDRPPQHPGPQPTMAHVQERLTVDETMALRRLAERTSSSLNTCTQAAWHLLLRHYTQQDTVTFGVTRACRHAVENASDMVGLLINTVPLSLPVDDGESVAELLARLRTAQQRVRAYETTPLPAIMEAAGTGPFPLFDSIVVYDDASLDARMQTAGLGSTEARSRQFSYEGQTNFPLTLLAYGDDRLSLRLEYTTDRYDRAFSTQVMAHLRQLLVGMAERADQPAGDIPYLTAVEQEQYRLWNSTAVEYGLETTLHAKFETQAAETPDRPALRFGDDVLTFREFNERANQLAHHLRRRGVGPDRFVGVFCERSFELMIAIYAIVKAGGAYVPLDPDHPPDRLRFMAEDAGLEIILTQPQLAGRLGPIPADNEVVDLSTWAWGDLPATNPHAGAGPDDLAYLLYTSGSTGRPKGVMIEHRSVVNRLIWMQETFPLDHDDVVLQKTPCTFDVSVWELFWPLIEGATLALAPPGDHRDPVALVRSINQHQVTTLHFVPSMLQLFVEEPTAGSCDSIVRVICSGEALPRALQDRLFSVLNTELHNLYGPTEAAIDVTWWACSADSPLETVPIGYPIANTEIHVLDRRHHRVPRGTPGELCIGGVQVARGYHNRPELTADRFVLDPFRSTADARMYRTGDLVRHLPDGAVEFLGRLDHQVKLHGQRIELGEIEAAIGSYSGVKEVVVTATGVGTAEAALVAYVVAEGATEQGLRAHIGTGLATYMIPSTWMFLSSMPLSSNGKVDRKALPAPSVPAVDRSVTPPSSDLESRVLELWHQVLPNADFGTTDTFFDAGGNSMLLVVLSQRLSEAFDRPVEVADLLRETTPAAQAALLATDSATTASRGDPAVEAGRSRARARRRRR